VAMILFGSAFVFLSHSRFLLHVVFSSIQRTSCLQVGWVTRSCSIRRASCLSCQLFLHLVFSSVRQTSFLDYQIFFLHVVPLHFTGNMSLFPLPFIDLINSMLIQQPIQTSKALLYQNILIQFLSIGSVKAVSELTNC